VTPGTGPGPVGGPTRGRDLAELLRYTLHAAADHFEPGTDGLTPIRENPGRIRYSLATGTGDEPVLAWPEPERLTADQADLGTFLGTANGPT
jgi:hypothetical protein